MTLPLADDWGLRDGLAVIHRTPDTPDLPGVEGDSINAIRFLAIDAIERAGSGHPGAVMALAPLAYRLFTRHMRYDPAAPDWPDRDRFVLSGGHASLLLYTSLHLSGYDLTIEDIKSFRQWGSRTPGHPELGVTPGVEIGTGPLGQGVANGVGMAVSERMLAARFNLEGCGLVNHRTWVICGDGDMMEGISSEAASLAGLLGLGKLTLFYDDNHISLEGSADVEFREEVGKRFAAYGWHVADVHGVNDLDAIDAAVAEAIAEPSRPSLIVVHSHIGYGSPLQDSAKAHGAALGPENVAATREKLGWQYPPFKIPPAVYTHWRGWAEKRAAARAIWIELFECYRRAEPRLAAEFERVMSGRLPAKWRAALPVTKPGSRIATRVAGGAALNAFAAVLPELVGGAADTAPSNHTVIKGSGDVNCGDWSGRNIHFGVREHAMGAVCNGMAAHGGLRPYCATFFAFSDYMRETLRMAALMQLPVIFVYTHDSIGLGEDGPTHQPIEHLAGLRAVPGLRVIRPADANESAQAWAEAIAAHGPTVLVFSRQDLPVLDPARLNVAAGAAIVAPGDDAAIVATGSEVEVALAARDHLMANGIAARVVSMPCWELFRSQSETFRTRVLPPDLPTVAVEAAATLGWHEFADDVVGLDRFGASAPAEVLYTQLGITPEAVADRVVSLLHKETIL